MSADLVGAGSGVCPICRNRAGQKPVSAPVDYLAGRGWVVGEGTTTTAPCREVAALSSNGGVVYFLLPVADLTAMTADQRTGAPTHRAACGVRTRQDGTHPLGHVGRLGHRALVPSRSAFH